MRERIDFMPMVPLAIFLTIGIIGVPPLRIFFSKVTDNIFYKDKYDYSKAVYDISEVLNRNIEWEILINEILKKINSILKLNFILLYYLPDKTVFLKSNKLKQAVEFPPGKVLEYISSNKSIIYECADIRHDFDYGKLDALPDKERERLAMISDWSDRNEIELILPIFFEEKLCCIVILGEKLSEEIYSPDDINLLKTFSYQASLTLAKAQLYKKVKDYSNNLEKKVRQRTEKIQNLQEAQKQMMCEIAHGLQTPLTIIRNELEILQEHAENKQEIKDIGKSIVRISDFIYNMLKLAKLDNDKESVKMERLNLSELLHDLIDEYKIITEDKGIDLIYDNKVKKSIYIRANKYEIEDMIGNLVSNSIKYMKDEGKKIVKIKYYINNQTIKLDIEDNGIGIEKDMIAKIFDRFYRVNASVKGSGLGLAICNSIAKRHNGEITVASEINKGSKFTVSLPLLD